MKTNLETTATKITLNGKKIDAARFSSKEGAIRWANECVKTWAIELCGEYRVVRPVDADFLVKMLGAKIIG